MNSFLDSNVVLGYIFCIDSLFEVSREYIFNSNNNFYSKNVKNEVNAVFSRKSFEFTNFLINLTKIMNDLKDVSLISIVEFHRFIENFDDIGRFKVNEMHTAFEKLWNFFDFGENQEVFIIKSNLNTFLRNFNSLNFTRKNNILNKLILIDNHKNKDKTILELIEKENLRDGLLHGSDEEILFDANEFAKNNKDLNLKFVTADQRFFEAITILKEYLSFGDCINLMEFSSN